MQVTKSAHLISVVEIITTAHSTEPLSNVHTLDIQGLELGCGIEDTGWKIRQLIVLKIPVYN